MYYREWSRGIFHTGVFLPVSKIQAIVQNSDTPGYSSIYSFVNKPTSASNLGGLEVSADCVTLDLDGGLPDLVKAESILQAHGLGYEVWESGGKGYHVHIHHDETRSIHLPNSHKEWVDNLGLPNDPTLYQHGRLFSLPGNAHPKTKKKKTLVKQVEGDKAVIVIKESQAPVFNFKEAGGMELQSALFRLLNLCGASATPGGRHMAMWQMAMDLRRAGLSYETAEELLQGVNSQWQNPKSEEEVKKAVQGAYKR